MRWSWGFFVAEYNSAIPAVVNGRQWSSARLFVAEYNSAIPAAVVSSALRRRVQLGDPRSLIGLGIYPSLQ
jgi:hypothetical protein